MREKQDVIILGGGLAGLTLALQLKLANSTLCILVLEKRSEAAPDATHKVGESTSELGAFYYREVIQLGDYLSEHQLRKMGFRFFFSPEHSDDIARRVEIGSKFINPYPTHQIDRGILENELVKRAENQGIDVVLGARVKAVELDRSGHQVTFEKAGTEYTSASSWVVDATGRAGLLKRKLGLNKEMDHAVNSAWFRVGAEMDMDDWSENLTWRRFMSPGRRRLATNHLMGEGYWVWVIPLVSGSTSIGIVADPAFHPFDTFNTHEKAIQWLEKHEPNAAKMLARVEGPPLDFKLMKHFAYDCKRFYATDRWALTGEAGAFLDPFYSPGSDFIALANTWITDLIVRERAGEDVTQRTLIYDFAHKELLNGWGMLYKNMYGVFGKTQVMLMKIAWDWASYWAVPNVLFMNNGYTNLAVLKQYSATNTSIGRRFATLNERMQALFRTWGQYEARTFADRQFNVFDLDFLLKFQTELGLKYDPENLMAKIESNLQLLEQIAAGIFRMASHQIYSTPADMAIDPYNARLEDGADTILEKSGCATAVEISDPIQADLAHFWLGDGPYRNSEQINAVAQKMERVQKIFLDVQAQLGMEQNLENLVVHLDHEPPEFRSIGYESASLQLALKDLASSEGLQNWHSFYRRTDKAHVFHLGIGLGWAFAKAETSPYPYLARLDPRLRPMVFDGMGYYFALFRGRRTIKNQEVPGEIQSQDLGNFDQGLGRRLWYHSKGDVSAVTDLIHTFPVERHPDLWRGVGIACAYVGGMRQNQLERLASFSAGFKQQLETGVSLAAKTRVEADSITDDIRLAYQVICNQPMEEIAEMAAFTYHPS